MVDQVVREISLSLLSTAVFSDEVNDSFSSLCCSKVLSLQQALERAQTAFHSKCHEECIRWCDVVLDYTWEQLHSGVWADVNVAWKKLYALSSLLKAVSIASKGDANLENALLALDKGILLGAPVLGNTLTSLAAVLSSHITSSLVHRFEGSAVIAPSSQSVQPSLNENSTSMLTSPKISKKRREIKFRNYISFKELSKDCLDNDTTSSKRVKSTDAADTRTQQEIPTRHCPVMSEFLTQHMAVESPVVLTRCMDHWPAMSSRKWSLQYVRRVAGARTVPVEIGSQYTDENWSQDLMTLSSFIDQYIINEDRNAAKGYVAQHQLFDQINELRQDICIPDYCCLSLNSGSGDHEEGKNGDEEEEDVEKEKMEIQETEMEKAEEEENGGEAASSSDAAVQINAWFGPSGTVSPLHFDPKHNLLAQVFGRKYIKLFSADQTPLLYPHDGLMTNTSQVNVDNPDTVKFPLFSKACWMECVLEPGQMLYIPPKCWHFVKSLDTSFSVSFWWE